VASDALGLTTAGLTGVGLTEVGRISVGRMPVGRMSVERAFPGLTAHSLTAVASGASEPTPGPSRQSSPQPLLLIVKRRAPIVRCAPSPLTAGIHRYANTQVAAMQGSQVSGTTPRRRDKTGPRSTEVGPARRRTPPTNSRSQIRGAPLGTIGRITSIGLARPARNRAPRSTLTGGPTPNRGGPHTATWAAACGRQASRARTRAATGMMGLAGRRIAVASVLNRAATGMMGLAGWRIAVASVLNRAATGMMGLAGRRIAVASVLNRAATGTPRVARRRGGRIRSERIMRSNRTATRTAAAQLLTVPFLTAPFLTAQVLT
jgi:hypothetical protein